MGAGSSRKEPCAFLSNLQLPHTPRVTAAAGRPAGQPSLALGHAAGQCTTRAQPCQPGNTCSGWSEENQPVPRREARRATQPRHRSTILPEDPLYTRPPGVCTQWPYPGAGAVQPRQLPRRVYTEPGAQGQYKLGSSPCVCPQAVDLPGAKCGGCPLHSTQRWLGGWPGPGAALACSPAGSAPAPPSPRSHAADAVAPPPGWLRPLHTGLVPAHRSEPCAKRCWRESPRALLVPG